MRIILDTPLSIAEIISATGGKACGKAVEGAITCLTTDSREVKRGDLFIPLARGQKERIRHATEAASHGATVLGGMEVSPAVAVKDGRHALLRLAALYKSHLPHLRHTVGITGSTGKTTVRRFISRLLGEEYNVSSTIENYNNMIGLSLSVLMSTRDTEVLVLEMGMNHVGEIYELAEAMRPDICVITNVGSAHIGNLGSREAIAAAKLEIITNGCRALLCPSSEPLLANAPHLLTFSLDGSGDFSLSYDGEYYSLITPKRVIDGIEINLMGKHYLLDATIAAALACIVGISDRAIRRGLSALRAEDCRARIFRIGALTVIDDTYNSSPEAAEAMLNALRAYPAPRAVLLGDMLELGEYSRELHYAIGKRAADTGLLLLIAVGEYSSIITDGARASATPPSQILTFDSVEPTTLIVDALLTIESGTVLVKGSNATELYRITDILKDKETKNE